MSGTHPDGFRASPSASGPLMLSGSERQTLLALARAAIEARVRGGSPPDPGALTGALDRPGAAFVSVHRGGELRGCLGCLEARGPSLAATVVQMASSVAADDPRFVPLVAAELRDITIEISVLGAMQPIAGPADVVIGRDGLVVERDGHRGLLLPQVAPEWGWDAETFLAEACRKAGLPRSAWREGARLYRFEAVVFAEPRLPSPGGET